MVYYQIDGVNEMFRTLKDAKHHVWIAFTQRERKMFLRDTCIIKVENDEATTMTPIVVTDKGYTFKKTIKI